MTLEELLVPAMASHPESTQDKPLFAQLQSGAHRRLVVSFVMPPAISMLPLTASERAIVKLIAAGLSNADIATNRGTSVRTVANQVASLLRKTKAASRHMLVSRLSPESEND